MKKNNDNDELRPEYDFKKLRLRKTGPARRSPSGMTAQIDDDVARMFPDATSVNEALRFLIRITSENQPSLFSRAR